MDFTNAPIVGAGHYGIVVRTNPDEVVKLFTQTDDSEALKREATIQTTVGNLFTQFLPEVKVPTVLYTSQTRVNYIQSTYLCGIGMEYIHPPLGYSSQVHTPLGYRGSDLDTEWGMRMAEPISDTNPTRGFFASNYTLEDIWEEEGIEVSIETLAHTMGNAYGLMLAHGILPIDLEWVWSHGQLWCIDFGLCEFGTIDPIRFYNSKSSSGLVYDFYVPHKGQRGGDEFLEAYLGVFGLNPTSLI